jgi:uncharacterized protein
VGIEAAILVDYDDYKGKEEKAVAAASRDFQIFVKPAGAVCNLACQYCYYLDKQHLASQGTPLRMADDLLEHYIVQHIDASPSSTVSFSWHGGEPTVLGLDYFRRIVELQRKHRRPGRHTVNGMQTNGILLNEEWGRFLSTEEFRVGLSIDGPADLHDAYRITRGQEPTHVQAIRAFEILKRHRIPCDVLCVLHDRNILHPTRVYRFFRKAGVRYLSFLPVVEPQPGTERGVSPQSVSAEAYGGFLCTVFDEWVRQDAGRIAVQIFEEATRPARGLQHSLCIYRETCGDVPVVERSGDFYSCDHFVDAAHRLGNIRETPLVDLLESPAQPAFGQAKRDALPRYCRRCDVQPFCNGGCPKDRFIQTPDGEAGLNYLCAGLKRFFTHCLPYVVTLASTGSDAFSRAAPLMPAVLARGPGASPIAHRNDLCPCGSGRKYKKCCLGFS